MKRLPALLAALALGSSLFVATATHAEIETPDEDEPVLFSADELIHDKTTSTVTAKGNVEVSHEDRVLLADRISFNQAANLLSATGNITLMEPTGEVVFAEHMELTSDLKDGIIKAIRVILTDGARIAANGARRSRGEMLEMSKAVYSPCDLCPDEPEKPPLWQLKAIKVVHDKNNQTIEYTDAWMELAGVPVFYTPYLSHPDPTVGRRSGLLAPSLGSSSDLGFVAEVPYYFNIAPEMDATVTARYMTKEGPMLIGEYRQNLTNGEIRSQASVTRDSDRDIRGHIRATGRFDIDDTWRWGVDLDRATDDTYLRRYGFNAESTLTSRLFAEGFRQRNYVALNAYTFQGLEEDDNSEATPWVFPMADYNHVGEARANGTRQALDASMVALTRTGGTDQRRISLKPAWHASRIGRFGGLYRLDASLQTDLYHVNNHPVTTKGSNFSGMTGRIHPQLAASWNHPFVRTEGTSYQLIEPMIQGVIAPNGGNPNKIPNEDSSEFVFDDTNLFSANRFAGSDRVEGGARVNYGLKMGIFGAKGGTTTIMVGQTYRPRTDDTFSVGSGLEDKFSDIVGRLHVSPGRHLDLYYRTRLDKSNLGAKRNEVTVSTGTDSMRLDLDYLFFDRQADSEFATREELSLGFSTRWTRFWRSRIGAVRDLTNDGGMRSASLNITYEDECFEFATDISRTFFEDRDVKPEDAIMFRINFKTLGEFQTQTY